MTKEEAEKERNKLLDEQLSKFCPVIKTTCNPTCVCLVSQMTKFELHDRDSYSIAVFCNHSMIVSNWPEV